MPITMTIPPSPGSVNSTPGFWWGSTPPNPPHPASEWKRAEFRDLFGDLGVEPAEGGLTNHLCPFCRTDWRSLRVDWTYCVWWCLSCGRRGGLDNLDREAHDLWKRESAQAEARRHAARQNWFTPRTSLLLSERRSLDAEERYGFSKERDELTRKGLELLGAHPDDSVWRCSDPIEDWAGRIQAAWGRCMKDVYYADYEHECQPGEAYREPAGEPCRTFGHERCVWSTQAKRLNERNKNGQSRHTARERAEAFYRNHPLAVVELGMPRAPVKDLKQRANRLFRHRDVSRLFKRTRGVVGLTTAAHGTPVSLVSMLVRLDAFETDGGKNHLTDAELNRLATEMAEILYPLWQHLAGPTATVSVRPVPPQFTAQDVLIELACESEQNPLILVATGRVSVDEARNWLEQLVDFVGNDRRTANRVIEAPGWRDPLPMPPRAVADGQALSPASGPPPGGSIPEGVFSPIDVPLDIGEKPDAPHAPAPQVEEGHKAPGPPEQDPAGNTDRDSARDRDGWETPPWPCPLCGRPHCRRRRVSRRLWTREQVQDQHRHGEIEEAGSYTSDDGAKLTIFRVGATPPTT